MRVLSSAFCRLKTKLPWVPADTKLSKLDTLRLATIYIQQLRSSLATGKELYQPPNELSQLGGNSNSSRNQTSLVSLFAINYCTERNFSELEMPRNSLEILCFYTNRAINYSTEKLSANKIST